MAKLQLRSEFHVSKALKIPGSSGKAMNESMSDPKSFGAAPSIYSSNHMGVSPEYTDIRVARDQTARFRLGVIPHFSLRKCARNARQPIGTLLFRFGSRLRSFVRWYRWLRLKLWLIFYRPLHLYQANFTERFAYVAECDRVFL